MKLYVRPYLLCSMHFFINHVSNVIVWCFFAEKILLNKSRDVHFHWYEAFIFHKRPLKESKSYFHWRHLQKENFYHRLNCNIINNIRLYKYMRYFFQKVTEQQDTKRNKVPLLVSEFSLLLLPDYCYRFVFAMVL